MKILYLHLDQRGGLAIGQPLPSLSVWLSETQTVSLDLEASYEETCRVLRIP
jgi:hypothetical protein